MEMQINLDHFDETKVVAEVVKQILPQALDEITKQIREKVNGELLTKTQVCTEIFSCDDETFDKYYFDCPRIEQGRRDKYVRSEVIKYRNSLQINRVGSD